MNWLPKPSLDHEHAAKRAKQRAAHQNFIDTSSSLAMTVSSIMTNQVIESGNILAKVVQARLSRPYSLRRAARAARLAP
jgi:hypothetical protein